MDQNTAGRLLAIFLVSLPLAAAAAAVTIWLYRRQVGRTMRRSAKSASPAAPQPTGQTTPARQLRISIEEASAGARRSESSRDSRQAARRLAVVYLLAGLAHSLVTTLVLLLLNGITLSPARFICTWVVYAWPIVITWFLTGTTTSRQRLLLVLGYVGVLFAADLTLEVLHLRKEPGFGQLFLLWAVTMGIPTFVALVLGNRAWRAVGLTALCFAFVWAGTLLVTFELLGGMVLRSGASFPLGLFFLLVGLSALLALGLAWLGFRLAARRYRAKAFSEQMFTLDGWWLFLTLAVVVFQVGRSGPKSGWFLLSFVAYEVVLAFGLPILRAGRRSAAARPLLLLRVFGHSRPVRKLADQVTHFWRQAGPVNLIGGTDLATALLEPDELMQFWSGRLRRMFVADEADLRSRLAQLDEKRDPDGRFRTNEFFCYENAWRAAVRELAARSSAVLMDLRGFNPQHGGCVFELGVLLNDVPLERIVLVADRATDMNALTGIAVNLWQALPEDSPNRAAANPVLKTLRIDRGDKALGPLLEKLFSAAAAPSRAPAVS